MTKYLMIFLILFSIAVISSFASCDCTDTDQDEATSFDNNGMDTSDGELASENCEKAINYLNSSCFMDFGEDYSLVQARCVVGGSKPWQICISDAMKDTDNCIDAAAAAEECEILI